MQYDDPIFDAVEWSGPITREDADRFRREGVTGFKIGSATPVGGLAHLAEVPTLVRLDLSGRDDLRDRDVAFLSAMPWLRAVSLGGCGGMTDAAVAHLGSHQALEQVNLKWTRTGNAAAAALAGKPALHRVILGASLTDEGTARLRDYPAFAAPGTLDSFLSLSSARTLTDAALAHVGALKGVAALDLHMSVFGSPHYTARGVAHLAGMDALEMLNFHGNLATDAVLIEVARIPRLRALHCQDIVSGEEGFAALGTRSTLEAIAARVCRGLTDRGFAAIARLPRLKSLGMGGPRLTDDGWAPLGESRSLVDLGPILSRDGAFEHIGRIGQLERLSNMYNRATTDAATRHLRGHPSLKHYHAFGTQIGDESLRILADLPALETLEFENCAWITDEGLRALARLPRLRRVSVWSCASVAGAWAADMPPSAEVKSEAGPPGQVDGYRAETLLDYPDLPIPADAARAEGTPPSGTTPLVPFGLRADYTAESLRLSLDPGIDPRWLTAITPDAFTAPLRIAVTVRPLTLMRLVFGGHNRFLAFDAHGAIADAAPWFMKTAAQIGTAHPPATPRRIPADEWSDVVLEVADDGRRLFVNGELRHSWPGGAAVRTRVGIGLQQAGMLELRGFTVTTR